MDKPILSVREMNSDDAHFIVDYFVNSSDDILRGMGADPEKLPERSSWIELLNTELDKPLENKDFYYIIWELNNRAVGHSNINNIRFNDSATMHLHLWEQSLHKEGYGQQFLKMTIPYFFKNFKLKTLACEPYAENPAPNHVLMKLGFDFIGPISKTPGWINFYQTVNRYELSTKNFG